jgi:predicted ATPase/DNA-binding XRE family transcriptional regulator
MGFAGLLRQLRAEAGLTQEELAEAAGLSSRSVSDLERGIHRTAHKETARLLADALGLAEPDRALFGAAARGRAPSPRLEGHNLPAQLTRLLGRERELAELKELLGEARLVTLTGTGGVGKTRLALALAAAVLERFPDGVWLADLSGIADPQLVASLVMEALGVRQSGDVPVIEALRYRLRTADLLLVLDSCEHLLGACAGVAVALLRSAPGLRVLATSREPLGIAGEVAYLLPPLAVPTERAETEALTRAPAVRLFLERASVAYRDTGLADTTIAAVARICRQLDGLPLAIELAAARTTVLSAEEIEAHLADRFRFLAYRRPATDPRHQALKAAINWSYELLSAEERHTFRQLSLFAGGFRLAEAAAVCCDGDEAVALDMVDRLTSKSLIIAEPAAGKTRYRLLETVRQYAAGQLAQAGEADQARSRHAGAILQLAERERDLAALSREHDNFRAALDYTLSGGGETGQRLARVLGGYWLARGFLQEGRGWLERALAGGVDRRLRADLLRLLGAMLYEAGDLDRAEAALSEGSRIAASEGLPALHAQIRALLAEIRPEIHDLPGGSIQEALAECESAAATLEADGDFHGAAEAWLSVGKLRFFLGESPGDEQAFERAAVYARRNGSRQTELASSQWLALVLNRLRVPADVAIDRVEQLLKAASGEPWTEAGILMNLAHLYAYSGRFVEARAAIARSRSLFAGFGAELKWAISATTAGSSIERIAGDPAAAERLLREGCKALRRLGERGYLSSAASKLADAVYAQGRMEEAGRLTEEAQVLSTADDIDAQIRWRATRAKLLARRGQFQMAQRLADEAAALASRAGWVPLTGEVLVAKAEVSQLAGMLNEAEDSLQRALQLYVSRRAEPLAKRTRALLASLAGQAPMPG